MVKIGSRLLCLESLIKYFIIHYFQSYQAAVSSSFLRGSGLKHLGLSGKNFFTNVSSSFLRGSGLKHGGLQYISKNHLVSSSFLRGSGLKPPDIRSCRKNASFFLFFKRKRIETFDCRSDRKIRWFLPLF